MNSNSKEFPVARSRAAGVILLVLAVFGFLIFAHRLSYYVYEYDPQYSPVDYGKFNILSYFTVQSNFACYVWLLFASLGMLGVEKAKKAGFNPVFASLVAIYVFVAGVTYNAGFPMGLTPPLKWDSLTHSMSSFIQVYYHMIMPAVVIILRFFPFTAKKCGRGTVLAAGIYPVVYSLFSIIRGAFSDPQYYPYPFYNPEFIRQTVAGDRPMNLPLAYLIIAALLIAGTALFIALAALAVKITNSVIDRRTQG